ncbi:LuxR family transcriptional regulator [Rhizobium lemnae]|uniref:Helix-turn-helix transcriptional regulator n=1 Tax=Rhizobium lemnae TaxID=1214924 RepID=A0ABV8E7E8_9HYPH|nr:LuxR family transcriptional regulator [Rhizobium lemnae]MCJ8509487.1 LuxR family transcriptional regulator [Rhizobium lemnae]
MNDAGSFYTLLGQLQDVAVDHQRWPLFLEQIAVATGAAGINVMAPADRGSVTGLMFTNSMFGIMDEHQRDGWTHRDHRAKFMPLMKRSGVVLESDFASEKDLRELEYYKFVAKFGFQHSAVINFSSGSDDRFFVLHRKLADGGFHDEDREHLNALRSQLQMASRIMSIFAESEMQGYMAAFERANVACLFVDRRGSVVAANQKAERLLKSEVYIFRNRLTISSSREASVFEAALDKVIGGSDPALSEVLTFSRRDKNPLLVRIERAGSNLRDVFANAYAMVIMEDVDQSQSISYDALRKLFGFTLSECRVACLLNEGEDIRAIAERCGVHYETTRAHMRSILKKTGTQRQAELCLLLGNIRLG